MPSTVTIHGFKKASIPIEKLGCCETHIGENA